MRLGEGSCMVLGRMVVEVAAFLLNEALRWELLTSDPGKVKHSTAFSYDKINNNPKLTHRALSLSFSWVCVCVVCIHTCTCICLCVCVHVCESHGCRCLWRPKVGIRNPPQSFSTSWIESGSLRWTQSSWASFCGGSPYFCLQNAGITDMLLCPPDMYTCSSPPVCVRSTLMTEPFPSQL